MISSRVVEGDNLLLPLGYDSSNCCGYGKYLFKCDGGFVHIPMSLLPKGLQCVDSLSTLWVRL